MITSTFVRKITWILFIVLAVIIGLYPVMYLIMGRDFGVLQIKPDELLATFTWNAGFYLHIVFGGIALLAGWSQFIPGLRRKRLEVHRTLGKVYVLSALLSSIAGFFIAWYANGGMVSSIGFAILGILWFTTTLTSYRAILRRDLILHERLMIYSYSLCFAAVTLRLWLPVLTPLMGGFIPAFRMVAWLCWVPNLIFAYLITRKMNVKTI